MTAPRDWIEDLAEDEDRAAFERMLKAQAALEEEREAFGRECLGRRDREPLAVRSAALEVDLLAEYVRIQAEIEDPIERAERLGEWDERRRAALEREGFTETIYSPLLCSMPGE